MNSVKFNNDRNIPMGWFHRLTTFTNRDIPITFGMPACQMNHDRQITAELQQKFYNLPS